MGIEQPVVFGFSFGGNITLNYAIRNPDRPARIIVVSCAARINPEASIRTYERLGGPDVAAVAAGSTPRLRTHGTSFCPCAVPTSARQPRRPELGARIVSPRPAVTEHFLRHEYLQHDYRDRVAEIRCPTLLLGGELDPIVPIQEIEDMASRMQPGVARVVRFPNAGHGVGGQPTVIDLVRDFVLNDD